MGKGRDYYFSWTFTLYANNYGAINNKYFFPFKKGPYNSWASYLAGMGRAQKPNIREDKFAMLADLSEVGGRA